MAERVPASPPFDTTALSDALHTDPHATLDLAFGPGQRYDLAGGQSSLEVFPEAHMSRITTPTSRLELFGSPTPQVIDGNVVFSRETGHEDTSLSVSPEGTVVFGYVSTAPEQAATASKTAQEPAAAPPAGDGERQQSRPRQRHSAPYQLVQGSDRRPPGSSTLNQS